MYIYIYIHIHIHIHIHIRRHIYICIYTYTYTCMYIPITQCPNGRVSISRPMASFCWPADLDLTTKDVLWPSSREIRPRLTETLREPYGNLAEDM